MTNAAVLKQLAGEVSRATRAAKFAIGGELPTVDPQLVVDDLGPVSLPLKRGVAKKLITQCHVAPYGKGRKTLVNTKVRKTFELDPQKFQLGDEWNAVIADTTLEVAGQLGLPADRLEAKLYKLLVYEKGGFFLPHRDSEKLNRMVASLIVVMPNPFDGGELIVRHGAAQQTWGFNAAAEGRAPCFAAFYADCEHEVEKVTRGVRLGLAYNLVLRAKRGGKGKDSDAAKPDDPLVQAVQSWFATNPAQPLVFAMDHYYTERGLSVDLLKGADRRLADLLTKTAEQTNCFLHLAQVSRHLCQFADDGSFGDWGGRYSRRDRPRQRQTLEIGEIYEDELTGDEWSSIDGKKQPLGTIPFELSAIVASGPIDDWKPTSEEFEGYTGNAGNTLDRWYHRSAIVLWPRDQHFRVIAAAGPHCSIPMFLKMTSKLAKTPKKRREAAHVECIQFASAIIETWRTASSGFNRHAPVEQGESDFAKLRDQLINLHDRDTIALFLTNVAERDSTIGLKRLVIDACREFGASSFESELRQLVAQRAETRWRKDVPLRDIEWLAALSSLDSPDIEQVALIRELCAVVTERFCEPEPTQARPHWRDASRTKSEAEASLPTFIQALVAGGCAEDLSLVINFVTSNPDRFTFDEGQVPALKTVIPWTKKQYGTVPEPLISWLNSVRQQLTSATEVPPTPPADWSRPVKINCNCQYCKQLGAFLADPANEVGRLPAREDVRRHLTDEIHRHLYDVTHTVERRGSPYSLVLKKTTGTYQRSVKRYKVNLKLLDILPAME